jgi:pyruvate kinase
MIARGDLAVELSFERLAEMQEEILWFGEACHLPVIWATQVLDNVAHSGLPTRAEVTDAAMSMRAECVMLNKGPHIATATTMLADIIHKMEAHQYKKRALYRQLAVAGPSA